MAHRELSAARCVNGLNCCCASGGGWCQPRPRPTQQAN